MFQFVIKKMLHNKWLFLCLGLGAILVTALIESIPIYSEAMKERILTKTLESVITEENKNPGEIGTGFSVYLHRIKADPLEEYDYLQNEIINPLMEDINLPILCTKREVSTRRCILYSAQRETASMRKKVMSNILWAAENIEEHINILGGQGFSEEPVDCLELMIEKVAYSKLDIALGETFYLCDKAEWDGKGELPQQYYKAKLVGVYEKVDDGSGYWQLGNNTYDTGLLLNYDVMMNQVFKERKDWFCDANWYIGTDYTAIHMNNSQDVLDAIAPYARQLKDYVFTTKVEKVFEAPIQTVNKEGQELQNTIILFMVPIIIMLILFVFMVTQFIVMGDQNEISQLKSRGASRFNIFSIYLIEGLIICVFAMLIGPILALSVCKMIGSANGFLEFVGRKTVKMQLNLEAIAYGVMAQLVFMLAMLIPATVYSRINIVEHKRAKRKKRAPLWRRLALDMICLGMSLYYYIYTMQQLDKLEKLGLSKSEIGIDPILYLVSTLFILGLSLFFLRVYPYIMRLIFKLGKEKWHPVSYVAFKQMSRPKGSEQFAMLFMMMAIGIGILNANEARSYNQNKEDQIRYSQGADVVVEPEWVDLFKYIPGGVKRPDCWVEPDTESYQDIKGVETLCKVVTGKEIYNLYIGKEAVTTEAKLMAFEPSAFGKVTWFKTGLLPTHINNYLNIMSQAPSNVFLSANIKESMDVEIGDSIELSLQDSKGTELGTLRGNIAGFVTYWPSLKKKSGEITVFMNYKELYNNVGLIPYQYYIKKTEGVSDEAILQNLMASGLKVKAVSFAESKVTEYKGKPLNMATNGVLTLGFIVIMLITAIGFLLYWIIEIKNRALQFGVLRAMGLTSGDIFKIIGMEQLLLFGVTILLGVLFGTLASKLFVPLLQAMNETSQGELPKWIAFDRQDYLNVYGMTLVSMGISIGIIIMRMRKLKIAQVLKLGED